MKKMKKILAMVLAMAMVLGMSLTVFADETSKDPSKATVTIKDPAAGDEFYAVQIIEADASTVTGWKFVNGYTAYFKNDNAFANMEEQEIIKDLIKLVETENVSEKDLKIIQTKYTAALKNIYEGAQMTGTPIGTKAPLNGVITATFEVTAPGVYFIKGVSTEYSYNPMAVYVNFRKYENSVPTDLENAEVNAKKVKNSITKDATSSDETDNVTQIGRIVEYTVDTEIPYVQKYSANDKYIVKDTLTGASYVTVTEEGQNKGKVAVSVQIGSADPTTYYATVTSTDTNQSFVLDLTEILANNVNANKSLQLKYSAVVTDLKVGNEIKAGDGSNNGEDIYKSGSTELFTGKVQLHKTGENNSNLEGAGFEVRYNGTGDALKVVPERNNSGAVVDGPYIYAPNATEEDGATTVVKTNIDGMVTVKGLDIGSYTFKEVSAPDGYSINTTDEQSEIKLVAYTDGENKTFDVTDGIAKVENNVTNTTAEMTDTKLSALPSTGGIGTTIFTIGGCAIMVVAAGLFFATRKKSTK